jgi:hypothetical protein
VGVKPGSRNRRGVIRRRRAQQVANRGRVPFAPARRGDSARIERGGDVAQGGRPGFLDLAHNGQHVGRVLIGGGAVRHAPELRRFLDLRAAELHAL